VKAAKLVRVRPEILGLLADGSINLSNLCLIAPRLEEHPELLPQIAGKTKREVEALLASFGVPREFPDRIRILGPVAPRMPENGLLFFPESSQASAGAEPSDKAVPALEMRTEFRFAAGPVFVDAVARLRALLWHKHPDGRLEDLLYEATRDFIARRDPAREPKRASRRHASAFGPRARRISAAVRRVVWMRDGGRCSYFGPAGPCGESRSLEIDHITPWALGGRSDVVSNLRLLCRAHNRTEATRILGARASLPG
jgi:5-methylcytosine-specific restriction endonuclease McrA